VEESGRETETVKVYEMLAAGLPVVATDLPELRRLVPLEQAGEMPRRRQPC
jgi:hypothetical protein